MARTISNLVNNCLLLGVSLLTMAQVATNMGL